MDGSSGATADTHSCNSFTFPDDKFDKTSEVLTRTRDVLSKPTTFQDCVRIKDTGKLEDKVCTETYKYLCEFVPGSANSFWKIVHKIGSMRVQEAAMSMYERSERGWDVVLFQIQRLSPPQVEALHAMDVSQIYLFAPKDFIMGTSVPSSDTQCALSLCLSTSEWSAWCESFIDVYNCWLNSYLPHVLCRQLDD